MVVLGVHVSFVERSIPKIRGVTGQQVPLLPPVGTTTLVQDQGEVWNCAPFALEHPIHQPLNASSHKRASCSSCLFLWTDPNL